MPIVNTFCVLMRVRIAETEKLAFKIDGGECSPLREGGESSVNCLGHRIHAAPLPTILRESSFQQTLGLRK